MVALCYVVSGEETIVPRYKYQVLVLVQSDKIDCKQETTFCKNAKSFETDREIYLKMGLTGSLKEKCF
jgi:hypothetical protein